MSYSATCAQHRTPCRVWVDAWQTALYLHSGISTNRAHLHSLSGFCPSAGGRVDERRGHRRVYAETACAVQALSSDPRSMRTAVEPGHRGRAGVPLLLSSVLLRSWTLGGGGWTPCIFHFLQWGLGGSRAWAALRREALSGWTAIRRKHANSPLSHAS